MPDPNVTARDNSMQVLTVMEPGARLLSLTARESDGPGEGGTTLPRGSSDWSFKIVRETLLQEQAITFGVQRPRVIQLRTIGLYI